MTAFLTFIGEYWLTILFGLIASGLGCIARKYYKLCKKGMNTEEEEKEEKFIQKLDEKLDSRFNEIETKLSCLTEGVLSIQGKQFKEECKKYLDNDIPITTEAYLKLENEHRIYNSLKGNHEGDVLFKQITVKYESNL